MQIFKDPNSNRFKILSQFCPSVLSFKIVSSPLVFRLFNYSCYFYISVSEFDGQLDFFDGKALEVQTDWTTPNIIGPTMLGVVGSVLTVVCKCVQQLPTMVGPTVHRGKDKSHLKTWETMCNPNNVGRAVQTDPTLLRYPSVIKEHVAVQILTESRYTGTWVEQRFNYSWASWFF